MSSSSAGSGKRPFWKRRRFWLLILFGLVLLGALNSGRHPNPGVSQKSVAARMLTKAEWKRQATTVSRFAGGQLIAETGPFVRLMGEPARTQVLRGKVIWYYVCADGKIQLVMFGEPATGGIIADVNEY